MAFETIKIGKKSLSLAKAILAPNFHMKTVLTLDPFEYVDLWLRREHKAEAHHYWQQSRNFYNASRGLPKECAPLLLYYCYINAAKALLASKGITVNQYHGVGYHSMRVANSKFVLRNEGIEIKSSGILPQIITYFNESESRQFHSLEDVLYNLVCVHRTFCLSFSNRKENFVPLRNVDFKRDSVTGDVKLFAEISDTFDWHSCRSRLPAEVVEIPGTSPRIQSVASIAWSTSDNPTDAEINDLCNLNRTLRRSIHYINGSHTLWYLKAKSVKSIDRNPITLMLAAMHRLSEICRYKPTQLRSFLEGSRNWLLSEFIAMSPSQFIDEIASEMTGHHIMIPNVRTPN